MNLLLHFLATAVTIGLAAGCHTIQASPVVTFPLSALAAALGVSLVVRLFLLLE